MDTDKLISNFVNFGYINNLLIIKEDKGHKERTPVYISNGIFHVASFNNKKQLDKFIKKFNVDIGEQTQEVEDEVNGKTKIYKVFNNFYRCLFWNTKELPQGCIIVKALSNGSIVDCYLYKNGFDIILFTPNPNATDIYKPLSLEKHIKYQQENGIY